MTNCNTILTASNIKYLLTMYRLNDNNSGTRCVRIAEILGVSKPSVHTMTEILKNMNFVQKDRYGIVFFTEDGEKIAKQYTEYFDILTNMFKDMLPDDMDMLPALCAMMSEMSLEQLDNMCEKINKKYPFENT